MTDTKVEHRNSDAATGQNISMANIGKSFLSTRVLNDVSFSCSAGEVHALVV